MNKQIFFGQYKRIASYFEGTELASSGLPEGRELEILQTVRDQVPPEVFTTPYSNPIAGDPQKVRDNLREAVRLFRAAGYEVRNERLVNSKTGEPFTVEFLADDPSFERVFLFYKPSLDRLGVTVSVRTVDDSQYENRLRSWDYDVITASWPESLSPGQRAARLLGLAGRGSARLAQSNRNQESGGRRHDRSGDLRQEPRRSCRRHQGARPGAVVESLRRPAMDLRQSAQRALGPFRPSRSPAQIRGAAFPALWWWDAEKAAKTGSRQ